LDAEKLKIKMPQTAEEEWETVWISFENISPH
jgi:hypothetical protein